MKVRPTPAETSSCWAEEVDDASGVRDGGRRRAWGWRAGASPSGWSSWRAWRSPAGRVSRDAEVASVLRSLGADRAGRDAGDARVRDLILGRPASERRRDVRCATWCPSRSRGSSRRGGSTRTDGSPRRSPAVGRTGRLQAGDRHRRARHARAGLLHRLPGHLHGAQRAPGDGDRRRGRAAAEARRGAGRRAVEGGPAAGWIVLDYLDCVLHVFTAEARDRYRLEMLWCDAPRLELELPARPRRRAARA